MKNIVYLLFVSALIFTGCAEEFELNDNDQELNVISLPGYVAFSAPGATVTIDDVDTTEDGETEELNVEIPGGTLSDVTVNFTFGGTAIYGVDFTVEGGSAEGGSIIIEHRDSTDPDDYNFFDNGDIVINLLTDDAVDGVKTLTVTLVSASSGLSVGRGGTDFLKTAVVNIADIDCPLDLDNIVGDWDLALVDDFGDGWNGASLTFEIDGVGTVYTIADGAAANFTISVPAGTTTLSLFFTSGDWDVEVSWTLTAPLGGIANACDLCLPPEGDARLDTCLI